MTTGIPSALHRWFSISYVLNFLMGSAFILAYLRNYYASNLFGNDEPLPFFIFLSPLLFRFTYFATKQHIEANKQKLEGLGGFGLAEDFDSFLVLVIKLFLILAFVRLLAEFVGHRLWHSLLEQLFFSLHQVFNLFLGN